MTIFEGSRKRRKKHIGYLPELPPLYMDMTVQEYLEFAAELKKLPKEKRESDISEVMKLTRLQDVSGRLIKNLSKGYKQRVGLAQAILGFPEIIILDEPTVGLDPKQIIEIRELIRTLSKKHTVILSSHILAEVREVCDYILIFQREISCKRYTGESGTVKKRSVQPGVRGESCTGDCSGNFVNN